MPEVVDAAAVFFDPENPEDIAFSLRRLIDSPELRAELASLGYKRSQDYSWGRCAKETFEFLVTVARMRR